MNALLEDRDHAIGHFVDLGVLLRGARDDQGRPGLVDQNGVHLIHDGQMKVSLNELLDRVLHVVAQIVEAEFVVRAVGHVGLVGRPALGVVESMNDGPHRQAQKAVDLAHPLGIALGQEVIDRHHVHPLARQAVEITRQRGHQGLAFAGLHFGDFTPMQHHPADHLDVVVPLPEGPLGRLAHRGEGLGQEIIQRLAILQALAKGRCSRLELRIGQANQLGLLGVDAFEQGNNPLDDSIVPRAEKLA